MAVSPMARQGCTIAKRYTISKMSTQSPSRPNRTVATLDAMRSRILNGDWPPGRLLAEAAVASELEVSRVPVREALFDLERDGLVVFSASGRAFVRRLDAADFDELLTLRLALEPAAARLASGRAGVVEDRMARNIRDTRTAATLEQLTSLDLQFHDLVFEATGHRRLVRLWQSVRHEIEFWLAVLHRDHHEQTRRTRTETADAHEELIECLRCRTPSAAERLMRRHILSWREWLPIENWSRSETSPAATRTPSPRLIPRHA